MRLRIFFLVRALGCPGRAEVVVFAFAVEAVIVVVDVASDVASSSSLVVVVAVVFVARILFTTRGPVRYLAVRSAASRQAGGQAGRRAI